MAAIDLVELVYRLMKADVKNLQAEVDLVNVRRVRAETAGGVPASAVASLPTAANGGLSDGTAYIDLRWASNGLKPGELTGAGTGVLVYYNAAVDQWWVVGTYVQVTT